MSKKMHAIVMIAIVVLSVVVMGCTDSKSTDVYRYSPYETITEDVTVAYTDIGHAFSSAFFISQHGLKYEFSNTDEWGGGGWGNYKVAEYSRGSEVAVTYKMYCINGNVVRVVTSITPLPKPRNPYFQPTPTPTPCCTCGGCC